ncbi:MAG: GDSL-type esterase/lipase family protein [Thiogranum sp.]
MKKWLYRVLAITLSLGVSLVVGEFVVRQFYVHPDQRPDHQKLFVQYDELLGWSKIPGKNGNHVTSEYSIWEKINSRGIRGPEYPYEKPEGEYRILVLGDSYTEGYSVGFESLFSELLKRDLNAGGGRRVEVINAGTGGYSTDQELLFFRHYGKKYNPDLVILMFAHNDVWYNTRDKYWRGGKPFFTRGDDRLVLNNVPVPPPEPAPEEQGREALAPSKSSGSVLHQLKQFVLEDSYIWAMVSEASHNVYVIRNVMEKLGLFGPKPSGGDIPGVYKVWEREYDPEIRRSWEMTAALVGALRDDVAAGGARFLVFYVPYRASIHDDVWRSMKRRYGVTEERWDIEKAGTELESLCRAMGIEYMNPTKEFQREAARLETERERLYYRYDGHWNKNGHALAASVLYEHITKGDFIERRQPE